ncbi:PREDICTED: GPI mannosyltransferase 2 [Nelumbo nucifera]|uniref:GPI mannosyltransferase 2 n=1 Tax=Nelumbo nucifera TaxID=4432 RepID=A0A1U8BBM3_NELNU|nr:PREDICTED: GPI mannosyltransferase 2 [Nelumbo nucifera]
MSKDSSADEPNVSRMIFRVAIVSRLSVLVLIVFWRYLLSPYDTSASLNPSCLLDSTNQSSVESVLWPRVRVAVEDSIVWDSVYFVRIAQCGYEYEQTYAFLPLLPVCINVLSQTVFAPLVPLIGYRAVLGLSGYILNNVAFLFAAHYFHRLSIIILKDTKAALHASFLFCFNPASIFYSSIYSESLYALFSLGGIYHLLSSSNNIAMLLFALSGSARSNGVLNAGYFCFRAMHQAYDAIFQRKNIILAVEVLIVGAVRSLCVFAPFIAFQVYGYFNICHGHLPDEMEPWCKKRLPLLYDYIQSHYWGVGFLRYFQLKQLPNFLLASPILSLALHSILHYTKLRPDIVFSLGFRAPYEEKHAAAVLYCLKTGQRQKEAQISNNISSKFLLEDHTIRRRKQKSKEETRDSFGNLIPSGNGAYVTVKTGCTSILVLPFILHLGFMAATAFFVMHVQVATRFLSANPPLYWFASQLMVSPGISKRWGYLIWAYSAAYILLGSLLFSNFYPFT